MDNNNPRIFFSYSWADMVAANQIDGDFSAIGIKMTRDVRNLQYGRNINDFTQTIADHDYMLALLSDDFLTSENCMYEVAVLLGPISSKVRILPIVLDAASHILKPDGRSYYYDYWNTRNEKALAENKHHSNQDTLNQQKKISSIYHCVDSFLTMVTASISQTWSKIKEDNYQQLLNAIGFNHSLHADRAMVIEGIKDPTNKLAAIREFLSKITDTISGDFFRAYFSKELGDNLLRNKQLYLDFIGKYGHQYEKLTGTAHYNLALLEANAGNSLQQAIFHYSEAVRLNPAQDNFHYYFGLFLMDTIKDYASARLQFEAVVRLKPDDLEAHTKIALLLINHIKDPKFLRWHLQEVIRLAPGNSVAHYEHAKVLDKDFKDQQGALFYYQKAIALDPNLWAAQHHLGLLLIAMGNFIKAAYHLEEAVRIYPGDAFTHTNLGWLYHYKLSDKKKAKGYLEKALRLNPVDKIARDILVEVNKRSFF